MAAAGDRATAERPLAWVMMEPDRALGYQVIRVRHWPAGAPWRIVGTSHAHGKWVAPGDPDYAEGIELPDAAKLTPG